MIQHTANSTSVSDLQTSPIPARISAATTAPAATKTAPTPAKPQDSGTTPQSFNT